MQFVDRLDAGRKLARELAHKYRAQDGVVYALPRGGIVLGAEIARTLQMPLDVIVVRKIGHPTDRECALAVVTESGELVSRERGFRGVDPAWFQRQVEIEQHEADRRRREYLRDRPRLDARGKVAILVDDGIATGLSMEAAIREVRRQKPARLVVAVPMAPADAVARLACEVDDVVVLDVPEQFLGAVGAHYIDFRQVSDREVIDLIDAFSSARDSR